MVSNFLQEMKSAEFNYRFDTSNGIYSQANGIGGVGTSGVSQYYAPDGTPVHVSYTADENGYVAKGSHIPTPHPIPAYILDALEHNRQNPQEDESQSYEQKQQSIQHQITPNAHIQHAQQAEQSGHAQRKTQTQYTETPTGGLFQYNTQHQYQQKFQQAHQTHYTIQQQFWFWRFAIESWI